MALLATTALFVRLQRTFLVMLGSLLRGAVVTVLALRTYKRDVATAASGALAISGSASG